ncbi:MAG: hypothetical protein HIU81_02560 [Acidobacteria bacterium]|nr:hypothetical protein [Acidobacteriota bacterium]
MPQVPAQFAARNKSVSTGRLAGWIAAALAFLCAVDLGSVLVVAAVGGAPSPVLVGIALIGFPLAFVLLAVVLILAIRRRR